jgi:hypothetical protein
MRQTHLTFETFNPSFNLNHCCALICILILSQLCLISCNDAELSRDPAEPQTSIQRDMGRDVRSVDGVLRADMGSNMDEMDAIITSDQDSNHQPSDAEVDLPADLGIQGDVGSLRDLTVSPCVSEEECDDGVECTEDLCNADGVCAHNLEEDTCLIEGVCVTNGEINADNECLICDSNLTSNQWTSREEFACDDGDICTTESFCDKGVCEGVPTDTCCGNGVLEQGETCDGDCLVACPDTGVCSSSSLIGSPETCDVECVTAPIADCVSGDGCCPSECSEASDSDCSTICGNGVVETGELCDGNCPSACFSSSLCSNYHLTGSAQTCDAECVTAPVADCVSGDGCCPSGCTASSDADCDTTDCELRIDIVCNASPLYPPTYRVQALDSELPDGLAPHGYLFHSGNWPDQELLPNWCLSDTGFIPLNARSGCIHATYEIGQCLPLDYPKACETTRCYTCP